MIRLLAFDLDGTTLIRHKYLSERNREALLRAHEEGVILFPATGRMLTFLPDVITALPGVRYVLTSNGGVIWDLERRAPIVQHLISNEKARAIQSVLNDYDIYVEYYRDGSAITREGYPQLAFTHFGLPESKRHFIVDKQYSFTDNFDAMLAETGICPEKINLPYMTEDVRQEVRARLEQLGGLLLTTSLAGNIEINAAEANKGAVLLEMAALLGVKREEILAIGDGGNDVTMLEAAGCSVTVADARPEVLAAAQHIVAAHDEDGLAEAVEKFILQ